MTQELKRYRSDTIDVTYSPQRCIHAAECVRGLPAVFDTQKRPWIQPGGAEADATAAVVLRCPTGALHYERHDGGGAEQPEPRNAIRVQSAGPLYVRGELQIQQADGTVLIEDTRAALCRCGGSQNKPFCDSSHRANGFSADGRLPTNDQPAAEESERLTIRATANGPLMLRGPFELVDAAGTTVYRGNRAALCRCGGSGNKPFCDGTHNRNGFSA